MPKPLQILIDLVVASALFFAVVATYVLDRGKEVPKKPAENTLNLVVVDSNTKEPPTRKTLRLAVTGPGHNNVLWDNMGRLLNKLGAGYNFTPLPQEDLLQPKKLSELDVIFACCAPPPQSWIARIPGPGDAPIDAKGEIRIKGDIMRKLGDNIRSFVDNGGTLYASDYQFLCVRAGFPEFIDDPIQRLGLKGNVEARVDDPGLAEVIGKQLRLSFSLDAWYPAALKAPGQTVYLSGDYQPFRGGPTRTPLLVKFSHGRGSVIFTSFHNEEQNSEQEEKLLRYLVFGAVTAKAEAEAKETLVNSGFEAKRQNLLSASQGELTVTRTHKLEKASKLRFAVGWSAGDATIRLTVTAPDGREGSHEATSSFAVEVPEAAAGEWKYTLTAVKLPYPNFPFSVTVGEK